jgi:hypothetical protein
MDHLGAAADVEDAYHIRREAALDPVSVLGEALSFAHGRLYSETCRDSHG